jgi:hypothetical protein
MARSTVTFDTIHNIEISEEKSKSYGFQAPLMLRAMKAWFDRTDPMSTYVVVPLIHNGQGRQRITIDLLSNTAITPIERNYIAEFHTQYIAMGGSLRFLTQSQIEILNDGDINWEAIRDTARYMDLRYRENVSQFAIIDSD